MADMALIQVNISPHVIEKLEITEIHDAFSGGQKDVFIATRKGQKVAIKILRYGLQAREQREINFYKNNTDLCGIPKIIEMLEVDAQPIIIEEYIIGNNLEQIKESYHGDVAKISKLIAELCDIMEPIWDQLIVHRDLKPDNIIIQPNTSPVVIDFGIYKNLKITTITETGFQPNTCNFASPEQLNTNIGTISYRSDYFSLGIIAFYLLFQRFPFGQTRAEIEQCFDSRLNNIWPIKNSSSPFNEFFEGIFHIKPSMRFRNTETLKMRLP